MGLHTLSPTPDDTGLGSKVHKLVGGLGAIKNAYDIGHTLYEQRPSRHLTRRALVAR